MAEQISDELGLKAEAIIAARQRKNPGEFADGQLRTLLRHLKRWQATAGPGPGRVLRAAAHARTTATSPRWPEYQ